MDRLHTDRLLATVKTEATATSNDPQALLHKIYGAVIEGDFDTFRDSVTADVKLNICGFSHLDGAWQGREEVVAATRNNFGEVHSQKPAIEQMIALNDQVAVLLRETGVFKSTGQAYSIRAVQWFTFLNGKLRKIDQVVASIWKAES